MKAFIVLVVAGLLTIQPSMAQKKSDGQKSEGRSLAELSFKAVDTEGKGYIHQGDMERMRKSVFTSMDDNENGKIELNEFMSWDFGFRNIAEAQKKVLAYETALKVVFSFWDRNGNGSISEIEHRRAIIADFNRADLNNDAILKEKEFVNAFSILVAIRAALKSR